MLRQLTGGALGFFFLSTLLLSGCALYDQRETISYGRNGEDIPEDVIEAIHPQQTTRAWVIENLGEPDRISLGENKTEIFIYRFEQAIAKRTRIFLLFSSRKTVVEEKHVYIHIVDGRVYKFWRDYELPALPSSSFDTLATAHANAHTTIPNHTSAVTHSSSAMPSVHASSITAAAAKISTVKTSKGLPVWSAPIDSSTDGVDHY